MNIRFILNCAIANYFGRWRRLGLEFPAVLPFSVEQIYSELKLPSKNAMNSARVNITEEGFIYPMTALMQLRMHEENPDDRPTLTEVLQCFSLLQ